LGFEYSAFRVEYTQEDVEAIAKHINNDKETAENILKLAVYVGKGGHAVPVLTQGDTGLIGARWLKDRIIKLKYLWKVWRRPASEL
jgi:hypothetical protein